MRPATPATPARTPKLRANGEGSVYERIVHGKSLGYAASIPIQDPITYKTLKRVTAYGPTPDIAVARRNAKVAAYRREKGIYTYEAQERLDRDIRDPELRSASMTVAELCSSWLRDRELAVRSDLLRGSTLDTYRATINTHILPWAGTNRVQELTLLKVKDFLTRQLLETPAVMSRTTPQQLRKRARQEGLTYEAYLKTLPKLSPTTVKAVKDTLSMLLQHGIDLDVLTKNVTKNITVGAKQVSEVEVEDWWVTALFDYMPETVPKVADRLRWNLGLTLGLRQSEVIGLTDDSFVLTPTTGQPPHVVIRQVLALDIRVHGCGDQNTNKTWQCGHKYADKCPQAVGTGAPFIEGFTKSSRSKNGGVRRIPLTPLLVTLASKHLKEQRKLRTLPTFTPQPHTGLGLKKLNQLVFTHPDGTPIRQKTDNARWHALITNTNACLTEAGKETIPTLRGHLQRHISATFLARNGTPIEIAQQIMGHSTTAMTAFYQHRNLQSLVPHLNASELRMQSNDATAPNAAQGTTAPATPLFPVPAGSMEALALLDAQDNDDTDDTNA
ncbi:tyrosine-type recombinase/integrase [Leucobacter salsicius]|uniref:tyrosine-type recombinase/integrase n=1 Tax=Leucobacter salsicius TaxID=664638 RepID=UPI00034D7EC6|nr:tyrosine-type recombinase/integrase [Leucobacter salsicius]